MELNEILLAIEDLGYTGKQFKPHKPLLLLALLDLIDNNITKSNKFYYDENLRRSFSKYFKIYQGPSDKDRPLAPFFHLKNGFPFWHLKPLPGMEKRLSELSTVGSPHELHQVVDYGYLSPEVYDLLKNDKNRQIIKDKIVSVLRSYTERCATNITAKTRSVFLHEAQVIEIISNSVKLHQLGSCIANLIIFDKQTHQYYECDLVIISYNKVYIVELKHWSGSIQVTPFNWIRNGKYVPDPHKANVFKAKILRGFYQHRFRTYPSDLYFESVVVLTNPDIKPEGVSNPKTSHHCPTFSSIDSFIQHLKYAVSNEVHILDSDKIHAIYQFFLFLNQPRPPSSVIYNDYEIVQNVTQRPDLVEMIVRPRRGPGKRLLRFRNFVLPLNLPPVEKERHLVRVYNTLSAVAQIGDHVNILKVWPVPDDTGLVTEGSDWSEEGTLRDVIYDSGERGFDENRACRICRGILSGLDVAHAKGVIHRAVKPENVLMVNDVPKLMNFDISYQVAADSTITVIPDPSVLKLDPYTAPEVYALEDVDDSTDLFSVGVILFELLCGSVPFKTSRDLAKYGGRLPTEQLQKLQDRGVSKSVIDFIDRAVRLKRSERFRTAKEALVALGASRTGSEEPSGGQSTNRILNAGETHDIFEIKRLIGHGTEAQVYEAAKTHGQRVALKVFHRDIPMSRIQQEEINAGSVRSSYLAHAKRLGHWNNDRYFIEMDYIEGRLMREDIQQGLRPSEDEFIKAASCLLEAVRALHERATDDVRNPLIHGDIKPDNIMLRSDGTAVLFDFGCSGPPRIDTYQGTEGYVAPDLVQGLDLQFCESGDLFALGISLFEWAFGKRPYKTLHVGAQPEIPLGAENSLSESLIHWLLKAIQTSSEERFSDVQSMALAFRMAVDKRTEDLTEDISEQIEAEGEQPSEDRPILFEGSEGPGNPFVVYLNTLHNASECNVNALAESQAVSEYFGYIHEPLKVTHFIYNELASANFHHIILTGHAGDGKSTVALELFKRCKSIPLKEPLLEPLRECEEFQVGQNSAVLVKDMSELGDSKTLELLQKALSDKGKRYLIVSNTGAFLSGFKMLCETRKENWAKLQNELLKAMERECPSKVLISDTTFLIINLSRINNLTTALKVFERMLAPELWQSCETCRCRNGCPIDFNVHMLRQNFEIVRDRVELVYRRLFEYGIRLTLRQITGHLAYAITGGLSYEQIEAMREKVPKPPMRHFLFFNTFFGDHGDSSDNRGDQLEAICQVRTLEPGQCTLTGLERSLWFEHEETHLPVAIDGKIKDLFDLLRKAGSKKSSPDELTDWAARIQARRILYLFGQFTSEEEEKLHISTFLQSPKLWDFHKWQRTGGKLSELERRHLQRAILHVLQEQFTGLRLPENNQNAEFIYITLNRNNHAVRQSAQIVLGKYSADNFNLLLKPIETPIGDTRFEAVLEEKSTKKELRLDLPFLDYVTNRFGGEIAQELQSFFADRLERFKVELMKQQQDQYSDKMMLVRLKLDHKFKSVNITVANGKLEVF